MVQLLMQLLVLKLKKYKGKKVKDQKMKKLSLSFFIQRLRLKVDVSTFNLNH
jgi:hypothetical protein